VSALASALRSSVSRNCADFTGQRARDTPNGFPETNQREKKKERKWSATRYRTKKSNQKDLSFF
jgi:hypothetical protein